MRRLEVVVAHMMARAHYQFYINIIILKTKRIRIICTIFPYEKSTPASAENRVEKTKLTVVDAYVNFDKCIGGHLRTQAGLGASIVTGKHSMT
jgi:hypothetical protein